MEPTISFFICTTVLGLGTLGLIFIRNLMLSRDKKLNDKAERLSLEQETKALSKFRKEMVSNKPFTAHYLALEDNREELKQINNKIAELSNTKLDLVHRYTAMTLRGPLLLIDKDGSNQQKFEAEKINVNDQIQFYENELKQLQSRRATLWGERNGLVNQLLEQEKKRNNSLHEIYNTHTTLLEKLYLMHSQHSEHIATKTIEASTQALKLLLYPLNKLLQYLKPSLFAKAKNEKQKRKEVTWIEKTINQSFDNEIGRKKDYQFFSPLLSSDKSLKKLETKEQKPAKLMI